MKKLISGQLNRARLRGCLKRLGFAALATLIPIGAFGQATVATLTDANHGQAGYKDGNTFYTAQFNGPAGIALDPSETYLFLADSNNNAVRLITSVGVTSSSYTYSAYTNKNGISHPVAVAVDTATNVYVLNRGNGKDGTVLKFNGGYYINYGGVVSLMATNASKLTNATAMALDGSANIYLTVQSNTVIRIAQSSNNAVSVVGVITNAGTSLRGITVLVNGKIALTDAGNNGIWLMDPGNTNLLGNSTKLTGFNGAGDVLGPPAFAQFNRPEGIAKAGNGILVVADCNNGKIKKIDAAGNVTQRIYGVNPQYWSGSYPGWKDGTVNNLNEAIDPVQARQPIGLAIASGGSVYVTENYYSLLRVATGTGLPALPPPIPQAPVIWSMTANYGQVDLSWSPITSATNYNVKRTTQSGHYSPPYVSVSGTTYTDTNVINGTTYYYSVSAVNTGGESPNSAEVSVTPPVPAPTAPRIGWFDYLTASPFTTVLHPVSGQTFVAHNDISLAVDPNLGSAYSGISTYYTSDGSDPTIATNSSRATPPDYADGMTFAQPLPVAPAPDVVIQAVNVNEGGYSAVTTAEFQFIAGNPIIIGNNAGQFSISDITTGAELYYTTDGSDPSKTNANAIHLAPVATSTNLWTVGFSITTNTIFKVRAFKGTYQPSDIVSAQFSPTNFVANIISFGFTTGEASSDFVASPGQNFYAPVTLTMLNGVKVYSLQYNVTVTNLGTHSIGKGEYGFNSMLEKPDLDHPGFFVTIPPYAYVSSTPPTVTSNSVVYNGSYFEDLQITNDSINLVGVGWLERAGKTNLYDTLSQDLITYSQAHDVQYPSAAYPGQIEVGGYYFHVPSNATSNDVYQIEIGRPSATSDGVGAPGANVYIAAPTNGVVVGGSSLSALKHVTIGQRKYIVGSVYPFRWFNAGDFGSSNIVNADVEQVFQSAVYYLNQPSPVTDFYNSMDSCGNLGVLDADSSDANYNCYTNTLGSLSTAQQNALFNGNDATINQIAFGDGTLDVCDVYVTFRRSLDPSLTWFRRFWNNGQRVADTGVINHAATASASQTSTRSIKANVNATGSTIPPQVNFAAGDITNCSAGQVIQVPITATIFGDYPLRVLMLNLTVTPLDGSPALTTPVTFTQVAALGAPYTTDSHGNDNFSAVWLNSTNAGLTGTVTIGTLSITIPDGSPANAAYAVHFDHASASPNGLASFPKQTLTGLITLSSRTNSCYGDGIPDAWRLRWFGTINNYLSASNACPSGDGIDNWKKYVAGVDPNAANNFPSVEANPVQDSGPSSIHWPTVAGKQYAIERSTSLFDGNWTSISTNTGTGGDMEFNDTFNGSVKFYRVRIIP